MPPVSVFLIHYFWTVIFQTIFKGLSYFPTNINTDLALCVHLLILLFAPSICLEWRQSWLGEHSVAVSCPWGRPSVTQNMLDKFWTRFQSLGLFLYTAYEMLPILENTLQFSGTPCSLHWILYPQPSNVLRCEEMTKRQPNRKHSSVLYIMRVITVS